MTHQPTARQLAELAAQVAAMLDQAAGADEVPVDFVPVTEVDLIRALASWRWRIFSGRLYKIMIKGDEDEDAYTAPFLPNETQVRYLGELHTRNVILKARQLGFCLDPATRVLKADLTWVRIDSLQPGDEVVSVDEHPPGGKGRSRKMRTATVIKAAEVRRMAYRVTMDDGRVLICTDQHPWLTRNGKPDPQWRSISGRGNQVVGKIKPGTSIRWITKPWSAGDIEDGWMGGMLDGEGSIAKPHSSGAELNVSQRVGPVWDRLLAYAKSRGYSARIESDETPRKTKHGTTPVPKLCFTRMDELFRLIGQTRPTRFIANRFWEGKELPGKRTGEGWSKVVSIEPIGEQTMIDMQTSTGTYIAEGFVSHNTTLIAILWLDHALFNADQRCGIVAHTLDDAQAIFRDKVRFAYDNLPETVRSRCPLKKDSAKELHFAHNNSSIRVATSLRSGTFHRVHVSEMGKISAKYPAKSREIVTGTLPAVPATGIVIIESTAEGQAGDFYEIATRAERLTAQAGRPLARHEYRFHFFPWWIAAEYEADPRSVIVTDADNAYFDKVEARMGCKLSARKRAWYVAQREGGFAGDGEVMWREYPSTPEECWRQSTEGKWLSRQMMRARVEGRITTVLPVTNIRVNTFWDIGASDGTGIWLHQYVGTQNRFLRYLEGWGHGYAHYVRLLRETGFLFGGMFLPHDAMQQRQLHDRVGSPFDILTELAPDWNWIVVPRVDEFIHGITMLRDAFPTYVFDEVGCKEGITHLDSYSKKWNTARQAWSDEPEKLDGHSEAADALRQHAQGFNPALISAPTAPRRRAKGGMVA